VDPEVGHVIKIIPIKCIFHVKRLSWRNNLNARTGLYGIACKQTGTQSTIACHAHDCSPKIVISGAFGAGGDFAGYQLFPPPKVHSLSLSLSEHYVITKTKSNIQHG